MKTLCLGGAAHGRMVPGSAGTLYIPYVYLANHGRPFGQYPGRPFGQYPAAYQLYVPMHS